MKTETKENIKANVITGASSALGAAVGVIVGDAISAESDIDAVAEAGIQEEGEEIVVVDTTNSQEPEIVVLDYGTVVNEDGSQMDAAYINVEGQDAILVDVDQDGVADVLLSDNNANGILDESDFQDISGEGVAMQPFMEAVMGEEQVYLAENDYVNDADVNEYMA